MSMLDRDALSQRARMAFHYADAETRGSLTRRQCKIAMTAMFGRCPHKAELDEIFRAATDDGLPYEEFERWILRFCPTSDPFINAEMLFALLDSDYKGYLVVEDFCSAGKAVGLRISSMVWRTIFNHPGRKSRNAINFDEFLYIDGDERRLGKYDYGII